jgi:uncharacterized membrane protein
MTHRDEDTTSAQHTAKKPVGPLAWFIRTILGGVVLILPIVIICAIIWYVADLVNTWIVLPFTYAVLDNIPIQDKTWIAIQYYVAPIIAIAIALVLLFILGLVIQTRLRTLIDWTFGRVPGVSTVYGAIQDVVISMQGPKGLASVDTVVLVPFPHATSRMAAYLMAKTKDEASGESLVCVYVPIGLVPPSGYTMVMPEKDIVYTDWAPKEVWKLMLSGGLTLPAHMPYAPGGMIHGENKPSDSSK